MYAACERILRIIIDADEGGVEIFLWHGDGNFGRCRVVNQLKYSFRKVEVSREAAIFFLKRCELSSFFADFAFPRSSD